MSYEATFEWFSLEIWPTVLDRRGLSEGSEPTEKDFLHWIGMQIDALDYQGEQ